MRIGVVFPTCEIGTDPELVREFGRQAEQLGYSHLLVYDHVLGAHPDRPDWVGRPGPSPFPPHNHKHAFHEAMVTMAYLAGATTEIGLMTGVLVLPQRQTALVAKQAAELELLRPGGVRLGVGTGWNDIEFLGMGADFEGRGRVMDEQIEVLRALWGQDLVTYEGQFHQVRNAGINPRPPRQVPVWIGGSSETALRRCARVGDGWIPLLGPGIELAGFRDRMWRHAESQGRDPGSIGTELFVNFLPGSAYAPHKPPDPDLVLPRDPGRWNSKLAQAEAFGGITHVSLMTMDYGLRRPEDHLEAIRLYADAVDVAGRNRLSP